MKVCLVSDQLVGCHEAWSGAEIVCERMVEFFKKENQEIIFITTRFKKKNISRGIFQVPTANIRPLFLKKIIAPFFRILGIIYSFYYLKKEKPDIVHLLHSNYLFIPVMVSAKILRIPTVFTVLDYFIICSRNNLRLDSGEICDKPEGRQCLRCISLLKFFERFIIRLLFKNLNGIITFTETSKSRLVKHGIPADKIKVIYTYNLSPEFAAGNKGKESKITPNSILFIGTFFEYKGLHILIQAMSEIASQVPNSALMVAGAGYERDRKRIEKMAKDLGLENNIKFLGRKKNQEVSELISKSGIVVVPEQWPSDFGPLILVEAMALGKPVVASKIGAIHEFIKHEKNGFLVGHNQPKQFAEKIVWLLKNKSSAEQMGEQAKKTVQFLFNDSQNKEILELYKNILRA
ncbi:glycosyltransferase family 4 protein [Candidatus Parcubacteria bacterium]|nr:glycosyltransferase family 4 protein [Candidatus Parcubacteria bacterium]